MPHFKAIMHQIRFRQRAPPQTPAPRWYVLAAAAKTQNKTIVIIRLPLVKLDSTGYSALPSPPGYRRRALADPGMGGPGALTLPHGPNIGLGVFFNLNTKLFCMKIWTKSFQLQGVLPHDSHHGCAPGPRWGPDRYRLARACHGSPPFDKCWIRP